MLDQLRARITRDHVVRFAVSFVLAIMLWGWVTQQQDPIENREISGIVIEAPPLPNTLQVVNELQPATVEISGPRSAVQDVQRSDVSVSLDASQITEAGSYGLAIDADVPGDVQSVSVEPSEVQVQVEATASRNFLLTIERPSVSNDPRNVGSVTPEVSRVTVSGPETAVNRVARVFLPIDLGENTDDFTARFAPYAADSQAQRIADIEILPETVSAFVEVQTRGKSVSVVPQTTGAPAEGFSVIQRTVSPATIVVDGAPDALDELLFVETVPVDTDGATESVVQRVQVQGLPNGVTVVDPPSGAVEMTVVIQEVGVAQEIEQPVEVIGLEDGLTARVEPETITVMLDAPRDLLRSMSAGDVRARIDLSGQAPGVYEIQPEVTVPRGVTWIGNEPQVLRVVVEPAATPSDSSASPEPEN